MRQKILFIKPCWPYSYAKGEYTYNRRWPPLSLINCASILRNAGCQVEVIDAHAERIKLEKILKYLENYDKIFITSSSLDRWQCPNGDITPFLSLARKASSLSNEVYILGYHGTVNSEEVLNLTGAKAVVRGAPEVTVMKVCQNNDLEKVENITFKRNGKIINTVVKENVDLTKLPVPAFDLLDYNNYFYEILGKKFGLFEVSRSCAYSCHFCNKVMYGSGVAVKTEEQIEKELHAGIVENDIKCGYFIDLDFLVHKKLVYKICRHMIDNNYDFKWACQTRADLLDKDILTIMKEAGCEIIHMGIESGVQKNLDNMDKKLSLESIRKGFDLCRKAGIKTLGFVLSGFPGENLSEMKTTYNFARKINPDFISFHRVIPYKGAHLDEDECVLDKKVDKFIRSSFIKFYLRPSNIIKKDFYNIKNLRIFWDRIKSLV